MSEATIVVLRSFRRYYRGKQRHFSAGSCYSYNLNKPEELEEFIYMASKDFPYRRYIYIEPNAEVIEMISKGVWLDRSWYEIEAGDKLPLHILSLFPLLLTSLNEGFLLYKEERGNTFNLSCSSYVAEYKELVIGEIQVKHLNGYTLAWKETQIETSYSLKFSMLKRLKGYLTPGLSIQFKSRHLQPKALNLLDRTKYRMRQTHPSFYLLEKKSPMEILYQSKQRTPSFF